MGFQVVAVGAKAFRVALAKNRPNRRCQYIIIRPACKGKFSHRLLCQYREYIRVTERTDMSGGGKPKPVAKAKGGFVSLMAFRVSELKEFPENFGVFDCQRTKLEFCACSG
jgi:hypothetical protein